MIAYKYDGTLDGIFTCVYHSFINDEIPYAISCEQIQTKIGGKIRIIETDHVANKRIITALYKYIGLNALADIRYAFRNGSDETAIKIFNYVRKTFEARKCIAGKFSDQTVLDFYDTIKKVGNEVHRMKGFLRFSQTAGDIYYAHFSPDNDIADLLLPHFMLRFKNMPFVIHDVKRNVLAMYNGQESKIIKSCHPLLVEFSAEEESFRKLWQTYYNSISIKERRNEKLMRAFMPIRYHEHLIEKEYIRQTI